MRFTVLGMAAAATCIGLAVAGCGSGGNSTSSTPSSRGSVTSAGQTGINSPSASLTPAATVTPAAAGRTFGPACAKIPATGMGSRSVMAVVPVATAASHNPLLTDLAHAIHAAGLTGTLNSEAAITVFAPDNSAFAALGTGNVKTLMANRADLVKLLEYHVVKGRVSPAELADRNRLPTLAGLPLHPVKAGRAYKVAGARIICGNVQTANATVYIVDKVLIPSS